MISRDNPRLHAKRLDLLGVGSFGQVWRGVLKSTAFSKTAKDIVVAIKILEISEESASDVEKELYFLSHLRSPYIANFLDAFFYGQECWIVMEYCSAGSLSDILEATHSVLNEMQLKAVMAYA